MDYKNIAVADYETDAIVGNPIINPPKPCGLALWLPGQEPFYLAWGHPTENNCSWEAAAAYHTKVRDSGLPLLFHNAGFDLSVWEHWYANARFTHTIDHGGFAWERFHDTMYLLFLADPYSSTLSLKPCAERWLGLPPTEQDELKDWILRNVPEATPKTFGAYISRAPGDIVGRYAIGDVVRTRQLFELLHKRIVDDGMEAAYDRERKLFPTLFHGVQRGVRIDRDILEYHETVYTQCYDIATQRLAVLLQCDESAIDDDSALADALERTGAVTEWVLTPTGKRSMAKGNLVISNPDVKILMNYRDRLGTCLQTFMRPWLEFSTKDGRIHPNWNQVRQDRNWKGGDTKGAKTGRLSSDSPNLQNVPSEFTDSTGKPIPFPDGLHPLPLMRRYCLPEEGHVWLKRDFSSQEIRILAHFEDGTLCEAYRANANLDPHQMAVELIEAMIRVTYSRKSIKITGFSIIYGSGVTGLSGQLGQSYEDAARIKQAYLAAMPGIRDLMQSVSSRGKSGNFIRTWGGRIYYTEPPKLVKGRMMEFSYKLLNFLIQGSAADLTKESINDWEDNRKWCDIFLATVHDEINISVPEEEWQRGMAILKECMNRDRLDVPMLSDGFVGKNWHDLEKCE